ncbi:MAG TPA: heparan-alpha-glucosaminide N-acetyltransferase domain-containing protein [Polyangiaceae bacterium]|nr:heparan-alpha-glucosaminide N-acetyltransferase domain-containing protein [Polyangiaceae bacterium]
MDASSSDGAARPTESGKKTTRLQAIDVMRGFVIALMAVDHSSGEFNAGRLVTDSTFLFKTGTPLPPGQFFTRWITHLCAPTFVFLAGTSLALSIPRRIRAGESAFSIDRHLFTRGLVIALFEIVPSYFWMDPGKYLLQVLYAIGTSFLFMIPLRRLPVPALVGLGACILCFGEAVTSLFGWGPPDATPFLAALLLVPGMHGHFMIAYPTLYWLAIMLLGYGFGASIERGTTPERVQSTLARAAVALLAIFLLVRGLNGYGNMHLYRTSGALVEWLHVSKYPPSLTYAALELGLGAVILWAVVGLVSRRPVGDKSPLLVLGRTPMFFYLLHIPLLTLAATALGVAHRLGIGAAFGFAALATIVLYPLCLYYGRLKAAHPRSLLDYV